MREIPHTAILQMVLTLLDDNMRNGHVTLNLMVIKMNDGMEQSKQFIGNHLN